MEWYLDGGGNPWRVRGPSPTPDSPCQGISTWKRSPHNICLWKLARISSERDKGLPETKTLLLKVLSIDSLAHRLTHFKLPHRGSNNSKSSRDIGGRTKLINFRARIGGAEVWATVSRDRNAGRCHYSFVELSLDPAGPVPVETKFVLSFNLVDTIHPVLVIH